MHDVLDNIPVVVVFVKQILRAMQNGFRVVYTVCMHMIDYGQVACFEASRTTCKCHGVADGWSASAS